MSKRTGRTAAGATARPAVGLSMVDGLAQLSFLIHGALERRATEHDLSMIQTRLLGVLRDRTPTMKELGRLLELDKSSVSGLVDRAERRGLVTRLASDSDGRVVLVSLTRDGRALVERAARQFEKDVQMILHHLAPTERAALCDLIGRLLVAHAAERGIDLLAARP